jgi:hypothetical protein
MNSREELLGVNIHEAQENYLFAILKQRQAPVHTTPFKIFCFTTIITV